MKKIWAGAILGLLFLGGCAQNKEKREEFKAAHDKDSLRNKMGDSAVANSEPVPDTSKAKTDSSKVK
ncbi:hypothetical protein EG344_18125 [Chryseobacterium sp. G0162]|uniref:hypothetical protein n=1 Tax=Chryseobacterium sp. G0162 TaxID=2487063 RepID=UPI000F503AE6|nr:hypothetical protein [Chryseobacterium sp. G0162]AZB10613.1 hypothetical protein EG344_18125 [Chryseobacterium sp. G0162]